MPQMPVLARTTATAAVTAMRTALLAALLAPLLGACASGGSPARPDPNTTGSTALGATARAEMRDADGRVLGTVTLQQTPQGVLLTGDLGNLPPGPHALHVHDVGRCEPPFTSAGGHFNPTRRLHGFRNTAGFHAGDLPNISSPGTGLTRVDHFSREIALGTGPLTLFDPDGSALVIHAGIDDYVSDPAGNSGARIACGVVTR